MEYCIIQQTYSLYYIIMNVGVDHALANERRYLSKYERAVFTHFTNIMNRNILNVPMYDCLFFSLLPQF